MDVQDLSAELKTGGRKVRRFLRESTHKKDRPGRGNRWEIPEEELPELKRKFEEWSAE